jgi:hypothetical protein
VPRDIVKFVKQVWGALGQPSSQGVLPPTNNYVIEESEIGKAGGLSTSWV